MSSAACWERLKFSCRDHIRQVAQSQCHARRGERHDRAREASGVRASLHGRHIEHQEARQDDDYPHAGDSSECPSQEPLVASKRSSTRSLVRNSHIRYTAAAAEAQTTIRHATISPAEYVVPVHGGGTLNLGNQVLNHESPGRRSRAPEVVKRAGCPVQSGETPSVAPAITLEQSALPVSETLIRQLALTGRVCRRIGRLVRHAPRSGRPRR
jgi:hypothetical protein